MAIKFVPITDKPKRTLKVETIQTETRPLKQVMLHTPEVRAQIAREAIAPPKCTDPNCGYRKAYEARKAKESAKVKRWREKRK